MRALFKVFRTHPYVLQGLLSFRDVVEDMYCVYVRFSNSLKKEIVEFNGAFWLRFKSVPTDHMEDHATYSK